MQSAALLRLGNDVAVVLLAAIPLAQIAVHTRILSGPSVLMPPGMLSLVPAQAMRDRKEQVHAHSD